MLNNNVSLENKIIRNLTFKTNKKIVILENNLKNRLILQNILVLTKLYGIT